MIPALQTGEGFWNPIVFIISLLLIIIIVYLIRSIGNKQYRKGTAQQKAFMSGNVGEPDGEVGSGDVYWGFMEAFKSLYRPLIAWHTGDVRDYVGLFVLVLAIIFLLIILL